MIEIPVEELLQATGADEAAEVSRAEYLLSRLATDSNHGSSAEVSGFEISALAVSLEGIASSLVGSTERAALYERAFLCRRFAAVGEGDLLLKHLVLLAADGILAQRRPEVMLALQEREIPERELLIQGGARLDDLLTVDIYRSFLLLARRGGDWQDLNDARESITRLRESQLAEQEQYMANALDKTAAGVRLVTRFNLARIVEIASTYTINGTPYDADEQIDRHERNMADLFKISPDVDFEPIAATIIDACRVIVSSSIWKDTRLLGQDFRNFVAALAQRRQNPTLELWPSQRRALGQHLLDPARRAIVVEMPTSAGKTLLAEFSIVQAHALNRNSTVAYLVPTRALVNQITSRLRRDFQPLGFVVEAAAPVFELDPTEDRLLKQKIDVLVCTPEKLDLLTRANHPSVRNLSLAVVDEAHNLGAGERGVRMELLLGTLKRERPETRFLLLTPFVPNAEELGRWLGDESDATISVNWRPSERVAATASWRKPRNKPRQLLLTTLDSADNVDVGAGHEIVLLETTDDSAKDSKSKTSALVAVELAKRGSVLVLVRGRATAEKRAAAVAEMREPRQLSEFGDAVREYVALEFGSHHPLVAQVERGVTYHHAGLSHDLRFFLELMIERGDVDVVCGTTTLAQGLNFPISSVILETTSKSLGLRKGTAPLSYAEFWNIAGRAGRALQDSLGLVVFPALTSKDRKDVQEFLRRQAVDICSHLMQAAGSLAGAVERFDLAFVRANPAVAVFLQYLAHAARVAGAAETSADIEKLLRSSLAYHQARESNAALAEQLISISRGFMTEIGEYDRGYLALADGTGFSIPSANFIFAKSRENPEFRDPEFWESQKLFGRDTQGLTQVIQVLSDVPELNLSLSDDEQHPFNARSIAGVTRDWVNGSSMQEIADRWFQHESNDPIKRAQAASYYIHSKLVGQVPWGIGALQKLSSGALGNASEYIPAMIFYGVPDANAVAMRMGGVPRAAAESLGAQWGAEQSTGSTFEDLRNWINGRSVDEWRVAVGEATSLSGEQLRMLWKSLSGSSI